MQPRPPSDDATRLEVALQRFDDANAQDPNRVPVEGVEQPRELVHARWLSEWVARLRPDASEALRLAARCQHIRRWEVPRESFPRTRQGYLEWRESLKHRHAQIAGEILRDVGYPEATVQRVRSLNLKRNLNQDAECQTLEDALCLVFLEHQLADLASRASKEKVMTALKKSWGKMSPLGREAALRLPLGRPEKELLEAALR